MSAVPRALVVEGGAMRGIFAAGVLDSFIEADYYPFDVCLGVSAGATTLAAYLSGQHKRSFKVITDISCRKEFISFPRFLLGGHLLDLDWLWPVSLGELPLDLARIWQRDIPLIIGTTRVTDGAACYFKAESETAMLVTKASCSVPIAYRHFVQLDGEPHTDGGVADSIPVWEAYRRGARHITVLLSHPLGYRKKPVRFRSLWRYWLAEQPGLYAKLLRRHEVYNQALAFIQQPPADCVVEVLAPPDNFRVGRLTRDQRILLEGYQQGHQAGLGLIRRTQRF